jgi:hypothetical protein
VIRCALLLCAMTLCVSETHADERSAALVRWFQETCALELPNFANLNARASAEKLPVIVDVRPAAGDYFNRSKSWSVALPTGFHELLAGHARGPAGESVSCGITAADPAGEEVKQDLMKALNLGPPGREGISPDGMRRSSAWRITVESKNAILLLVDATPSNVPGIFLNLSHRSDAEP